MLVESAGAIRECMGFEGLHDLLGDFSPSVFSKDEGMRLPLAFAETPIPFFAKFLARYHSRLGHGWTQMSK